MTSAAFFVPGKPRGKGRPRFTRSGVAYTDEKTREYEDRVRSAFRRNARDFYADKGEAVTMSIVIRMPVPKSWSKKRKEMACSGELAPLVKPDIDNVCKAVMDALNGDAWHDDTQVVRMDVHKNYVGPSLSGVAVFLRKLKRTIRKDNSRIEIEYHALHGLSAEVGELHSIYQKVYQGHEAQEDHIKKELGDLLWFIAEFCFARGWELADIAQMNIDKLLARYPDGFSADKSLHRKDGDI